MKPELRSDKATYPLMIITISTAKAISPVRSAYERYLDAKKSPILISQIAHITILENQLWLPETAVNVSITFKTGCLLIP